MFKSMFTLFAREHCPGITEGSPFSPPPKGGEGSPCRWREESGILSSPNEALGVLNGIDPHLPEGLESDARALRAALQAVKNGEDLYQSEKTRAVVGAERIGAWCRAQKSGRPLADAVLELFEGSKAC